MKTMKNIATDDSIREMAFLMAKANGTTTTLDVKNSLRKMGFYMTQDRVSEIMSDMERSGELKIFADNGTHRTYEAGSKTTSKSDDYYFQVQRVSDVMELAIKGYNSLISLARIDDSSYVAYHGDHDVCLIFDPSVSRDRARSLFAKEYSVNRNDVRASSIEILKRKKEDSTFFRTFGEVEKTPNYMDIWSKEGTKVIAYFENGKLQNGYDSERKFAETLLREGVEYTIDHTDVHDFSTDVYLKEFETPPSQLYPYMAKRNSLVRFNSVHFLNAEKPFV